MVGSCRSRGGSGLSSDRWQVQSNFFEQIGKFSQILDVLERIPGAMFMVKDLDSRYIYMSTLLREAIHQKSPEDVIGKTDFDLFPKIIAESFRQNDLLVFHHGKPLVNEVHLTCFFSQSPLWSFSSKYPVHGRSGEVIGLVTLNEPYDHVMGKHAELNRLIPAIDHVTRHYSEPITIGDLSGLCNLSESHFMRVFKQRLNMTAYAFVEQVRMLQAMESLKQSDASITQVALDCGFYDHSAFAKRFKKFTGTTPLRFRQNYQSQFNLNQTLILPKIY